jgi:hypothetical protein
MPIHKAAERAITYIFTKMVKKYQDLHLIVTEKEAKLLVLAEPVSSICNYINTGKVFKDGYTFFSSPINNSNFKK